MNITSEFSNLNSIHKYALMYFDKCVLIFPQNITEVQVVNKEYLPFGLKYAQTPENLKEWLRNRATPLTRSNVEFIYMMCGESRTERGQIKASIKYGSTSINDCFWVKASNEVDIEWEDINPFTINHDRAFGLFVLAGDRNSATDIQRFSPEITLQGNWSKCLVRNPTRLLLYKADDRATEQEISLFGRLPELPIVEYWQEEYEGVVCSVCRIESNEQEQWISAEEYGQEKAILEYPIQYSIMKTFDYIVGNVDGHSLNWSVVVDKNLKPKNLSKMYDFNFGLMSKAMEYPEVINERLVIKAHKLLQIKTLPFSIGISFFKQRVAELLEEISRREQSFR